MEFSKSLDAARKKLGFKSQKQFYSFLAQRGVAINYQHYMKIVKGQQRATPEFIAQLAHILPDRGDELILVYCQDLFQKHQYLFKTINQKTLPEENKIQDKSQAYGIPTLSHAQVKILAQRKEAYFLFIIGTISRRPLQKQELKVWFEDKTLSECLGMLLRAKIFIENEDGYQTFSSEIRFPAKDKSLEGFYGQMDSWDLEFSDQMKFESLLTKKMIRRISPRYMNLLMNHFSLIFEAFKASDEIDTRHNSEVIQLSLSFSKGKLPG